MWTLVTNALFSDIDVEICFFKLFDVVRIDVLKCNKTSPPNVFVLGL